MHRITKYISAVSAAALLAAGTAYAQLDTIWLSTAYTTHVLFSTDVTYKNISNLDNVAGLHPSANKNMIALRALQPFEGCCSFAALEANGRLHTYIVGYRDNPPTLVIDARAETAAAKAGTPGVVNFTPQMEGAASGSDIGTVSTVHYSDAPVLQDIYAKPRELFHIGEKMYDIEFYCENIYSYSDITYLVFRVVNKSGISYESDNLGFSIENKSKSKRALRYGNALVPKSTYGSLKAPAGGEARIALTFDKITLKKDQVLTVFLNEEGGQRHFILTLSEKDINNAVTP